MNGQLIRRLAVAVIAFTGLGRAAEDVPVDTHMRTPTEELATITVPDGYHLELVASDPDVVCPVLCDWDGDGRMYVAEMRSYMLDLNGAKAHTPISRVSRWEQTRENGVYDKHTVFADKLMLPRMVLTLDDRVWIRETDTKDIWQFRDTTGAGMANEKVKIYEGGKQEGNLEHQPSGLIWDIDNWLYVTAQTERFRFTRGKIEKESLPFNPGQWGIAITDNGQLIFNRAGSERPAFNFQVMPQYGDIGLPGELGRDFEKINPIEYLTDVEGGPPRLRPQGGLNRFSGCAGGCVYRGDALPGDLYGDYILPEPVGRLIRRAKVSQIDGKTVITNPDPQKEFIASTDPNFRPVWSATGPDGCLYFCDMYHGVIQEANWTKEGTFLRDQIKKYGLQKNVGRGRIWRLVHDGFKRREQPRMLEETAEQLVKHLSDANGWWRDTAQKLIILKGDKSVVPTLENLARNDAKAITRLHAFWTLEGLDAVSNVLLIEKLKETDPRLRAAAVRIAEPLIRNNDPEVIDAIGAMATDPDAAVAEQLCVSVMNVKWAGGDKLVSATMATPRAGASNENLKDLVESYRRAESKAAEDARKDQEMKKSDSIKGELFAKGRVAYSQTCVACHGADGLGMPAPEHNGTTIAPPLVKSAKLLADRQLVASIVLHGLTGPNNGVVYPGQMASFKWANDEWIASILTYARNDWGNKATAISAVDVAAVRRLDPTRNRPFTVEELYLAVQSACELTPSGARVTAKPGQILLDPCKAILHGNGIGLNTSTTGLEIGKWYNWQAWASWSNVDLAAGDYTVTTRMATPTQSHEFSISIGSQQLIANVPGTKTWEHFQDVVIGSVHLDKAEGVDVEIHPRGDDWNSVNLASIRLMRANVPLQGDR